MMTVFPNTPENLSYAESLPQPRHIWIDGARIVVEQGDGPSIAPLADRQADAWERIKAKRDTVKSGGVFVSSANNWLHSDTESRVQQLGLKDEARDVLAAGGTTATQLVIDGAQVYWKTINNGFVPMTVQLAFDIVAAVKVLDKRAHATAVAHQAAMMASADPDGFDFSAGWPETYV